MPVTPPSPERQRSTQVDRLGSLMAHRLNESPASPDVRERLRVAREQALRAARQQQQAPASWWQRLKHRWAQQPGQMWNVVAVTAGAAAFAVSFLVVQAVNDARETSELAEVDTMLLTDDLPPEAYSDPGFMRFLRNTPDNSQE
ncbi:DUF3619 family protein [Comamonas serinivorans]|nr:DUF3619 family protein [Comamonas serinivorans]